MSKAIVFKSGNSIALRLPMEYARRNHLEVGTVVPLPDKLTTTQEGNVVAIMQKFKEYSDKNGGIASIEDPVAWQQAIRDEVDPWHEVIRDIGR